MIEDSRIKYGCIEGCSDYEEQGLTACNDCITEWQLYIKGNHMKHQTNKSGST